MKSEIVFEKRGLAFTDSLIISEKSEVQHESVVRLITNNIEDLKEFGDIVFSDFKSGKRGRPTRVYYPNERQATLILTYLDNTDPVKKFKKNLVKAFFEMASFIQSLTAAKMEHPAFTEAIMNANDEPKHYHFSNEADMINRIVLGVSAKKYREANGLAKGVSIRPHLTIEQIKAIETLQRVDIGFVIAIPDFEQRKQALMSYHRRLKLKRIA